MLTERDCGRRNNIAKARLVPTPTGAGRWNLLVRDLDRAEMVAAIRAVMDIIDPIVRADGGGSAGKEGR